MMHFHFTFIISLHCGLHFLLYFHFMFVVYSKALCHFMDVLTGPMMQSLENRLAYNKERARQLELEKLQLTQLVEKGDQDSGRKSTFV